MHHANREQILTEEMTPWLERGYIPRHVTDQSAYLVEQRTFSLWWLLAWGVIIPFFGLAMYTAYVAGRYCKTVTITVDGSGRVWVQEDRTPSFGKEPPPILRSTLKRRMRSHLAQH